METKVFAEQMKRLENAYQYKIADIALKTWREELVKDNTQEQDLVYAIDAILHNSDKYRYNPNLGNLLEECSKARDLRLQKQHYENTQTTYKNIKANDKMAKRSLRLIELMLSGKITKEQKVEYMFKMEEFYPGKGWQKEAVCLAKEFKI